MTEIDRPEVDTNILHEARARLRREMLLVAPWTEVILVRHAQQALTDTDLAAGGAAGPRLSDTGQLQATLTGEHLAQDPLAAVYCSHLRRASETADAVARSIKSQLSPTVRTELREIEACGDDREDSAVVRNRLTKAITGIASAHPSQTVAVVSHGGAISAFLASLLGIESDIFFFAAHASITRVRFHDGHWAVQSINETDHLRSHHLISH